MRHLLPVLLATLALSSGLIACGGGTETDAAPQPDKFLSMTESSVSASTAAPVVHMLGDSTMTIYNEDRRPQMGWGEAVPKFFDASVKVNNWALGGRSSKSFYYEATRWPAIVPKIAAGDYVIIQFGHNDQKSGSDYRQYGTYAFCSDGSLNGETCTGRPDKVDPAVDIAEHSYYQWLKKYVHEVRARGASPVLMSPIVRKYFSGATITAQGQHHLGAIGGEAFARGDYVAAMKAVAAKYSVPFVDLTAETKTIVESYGNASATANLYIAADSTHPQVLFANLIAKRAVEGLKGHGILSTHMVPVTSLIASPAALDYSARHLGIATVKSVTLSAFDLAPAAGTVTVRAPLNFALSLDNATWSQSVNIAYANGAFIQPLAVRFIPTEAKSYSGSLSFAIGSQVLGTTLAVQGSGISGTGGVPSYAGWFSAGTSLSPTTDGLVSASSVGVSGLAAQSPKVIAVDGQDTTVARYVADSPARNNSQYLQFAVAPATGTFSVNTISAYLTTSGGSTVVADIEYSLSPDFSGATKLNTAPLTFVKDTFTARLSYPVAVQVPPGSTLYVRVFPWNSAGVLGKMLAIYGVRISGSASNPAPALVDGTSRFSLLRSGLTWNRITGKYSGSITLTNTSGATLAAPYQLAFNNLSAGVTLDNASGVHGSAPYITVATPSLAAGASLTVPITFSNPNRVAIGYSNTIYLGNI